MRLEVENGKYTYIQDEQGSRALRYGEPWRDLTGDKFVGALAWEVQELREIVSALSALSATRPDLVKAIDAALAAKKG
jgi:hypothetical protein